MSSSRLRGNILPIFTIKKGTATAVSYADDLKKYDLSNAAKSDSDLTFAEAAAGLGVDWTFKATLLVSFDTASLYGYLWDNPGAEVEILFGPYGNATASATKPHFRFMAVLPAQPALSNEARTSLEGAEVEVEIKATTAAVKIVA